MSLSDAKYIYNITISLFPYLETYQLLKLNASGWGGSRCNSVLEPHYVSIRYEIIGLFKVSPTFTERNKICFTTFEYKRKILVYVYDALCDLILYPWQE